MFLLCVAVQYIAYRRLLSRPLRDPDLDRRRLAMTEWIKFAIVWQVLVLVGIAAYAIPMARHHPHGLAWIAPPVGAVLGTALPLQAAAMRILRATRA